MNKDDFEAQFLCKFELSKEDRALNDRVEAYLISSSGASFEHSVRLSRELKQWCLERGIPKEKLDTTKMIVGGRIKI